MYSNSTNIFFGGHHNDIKHKQQHYNIKGG